MRQGCIIKSVMACKGSEMEAAKEPKLSRVGCCFVGHQNRAGVI